MFPTQTSKVSSKKEILKQIEERFSTKLQRKTGWGKNEVLATYKEAVQEVLLEIIEF